MQLRQTFAIHRAEHGNEGCVEREDRGKVAGRGVADQQGKASGMERLDGASLADALRCFQDRVSGGDF